MTPAEAKERARERIARILATGRWPTGVGITERERELLRKNAEREGLL